MMTKTRCIMKREFSSELDGRITHTFRMRYEDTNVIQRTVELDAEDWEEMGRPETITVTIEPGDRLNDEFVCNIPDCGKRRGHIGAHE